MSEHPYPKNFPKDDPRLAVQLAWKIMDSVRPGLIPPIARFDLAGQIAGAFSEFDELRSITKAASGVTEAFSHLTVDDLGRISMVAPELLERIAALNALIALFEAK